MAEKHATEEQVDALADAIKRQDGETLRRLAMSADGWAHARAYQKLWLAATAEVGRLRETLEEHGTEPGLLIAERNRYREAADVFAHYYDAVCDQLEGTDLAYLRARGSLNERYLKARETVTAFDDPEPASATQSAPKL